MSSKDPSKSLASSIGSLLFSKKRAVSSVRDRRGSSGSMGFQVRSKSLEDLVDIASRPPAIGELNLDEHWSELTLLKSQGTHIVCILPSTSLDFVVSCLYAIGVNPLIPEDVDDVAGLLVDCKGVLVDVSAREALLEAFTEHHIGGIVPLVLLVTNSGTDDKRKTWARKIMEKCDPNIISGHLGDIHALSQDVVERAGGILEEDENIDTVLGSGRSGSKSPLPGSRSPLPGRKSPNPGKKSPIVGRKSPGNQRDFGRKSLGRVNTAIPQLAMRGQFRHQTMKHILPQLALESGRLLAAYSNCFVHLFELNTVTCGEFFLETTNVQFGMNSLHSTAQAAAAIITSTLACVEEEGNEVGLPHCSHGISFYSVAAERAELDATLHVEHPQPGTLRVCFVDRLHQLNELEIRVRAGVVKHNIAPGS